ncbi:hypothetical protein AAFF_G00234460 [Aldrovandia affinis]|uniref:ribonuclease H n=1 Tax=Aldrovandia affinis TaxID=143900 RepID=A0AAD7SVZ0_9TELE|nr:hypothetical protein AAFF_G00234460 [Aldrovandia affinis]
MVLKPDGGCWLCGDYCRLNDVTTPYRYPVPNMQDFSAQLAGKVFQCRMDSVLRDLTFLFPYLDDILVASDCKEEHPSHLWILFDCLNQHGLIVNPAKRQFGLPSIDFLGHHIAKDGPIPLTLKGKAPNHAIDWSADIAKAFVDAKQALATTTMLAHPLTDSAHDRCIRLHRQCGPQAAGRWCLVPNCLLQPTAPPQQAEIQQLSCGLLASNRDDRASLKDDSWCDRLPWVLLGIRTALKEDLQSSSAELVYGQPLRVPRDFIPNASVPWSASLQHSTHLSRAEAFVPVSTSRHGLPQSRVPGNLYAAEFVFVRHNAHQSPLQPPYSGLFRFLEPGN